MEKTRKDYMKDYNKKYRTEHPNYHKDYMKDYCIKNPNYLKIKELKRKKKNPRYPKEHALFARYGITQAQYNDMFIKQEGRCIICTKHQSQFKRAFHVDHKHASGEVRGLLCVKCNVMLGYAEDSIDTLKNAIKYLTKKNL